MYKGGVFQKYNVTSNKRPNERTTYRPRFNVAERRLVSEKHLGSRTGETLCGQNRVGPDFSNLRSIEKQDFDYSNFELDKLLLQHIEKSTYHIFLLS